MKTTLSSLVPQLPRRAWKVLAGDSIAAIGTGLVLPFMVVYLRDVRGFHVQTAAFVLSALAITGVVFGAPLGSLVDRLGPRRMLIASLLLCATSSATFSQVQEPWQAGGSLGDAVLLLRDLRLDSPLATPHLPASARAREPPQRYSAHA